MNFNLISPDGEGQKFNVKFQEPIVIPPNAKIGLNFAQFERNGHFDFVEDQKINLAQDTQNVNVLPNQVFPRMKCCDLSPTNFSKGNAFRPVSQSNTDPEQGLTEITIPKGTYTFDNLNLTIQTLLFQKGFPLVPTYPNVVDFFGTNNIPTIKQNACCSLYNKQALPNGQQPNEMQLGFYNDAIRDYEPHLLPSNQSGMYHLEFSTQHLKNATNTEFGSNTNKYVPSQNSSGADYESFAMGRHRIIHLDNTLRLQLANDDESINDNLETQMLNLLETQLNALTVEKANANFTGSSFMGFYSIDYAGLNDENQVNFDDDITGIGGNGNGFTIANHNCRKGKDGSATASPADTDVITGDNLVLNTETQLNPKCPNVFFGVNLSVKNAKNVIEVFASPSMIGDLNGGNLTSWRTRPIQDLKLIKEINFDDFFGLPPQFLDDQIRIHLHWVEESNNDGSAVVGDMTGINNLDTVYYPLVFISPKDDTTKQMYCVFDGRFHTFPGESNKIGLSKIFLLGNDLNADDLGVNNTTSLARRGTDLPLTPFFASTNTATGFEDIMELSYRPLSGELNDGGNPLRSNHILRYVKFKVSEEIASDLFNFQHKNEVNENVDGNVSLYPVIDEFTELNVKERNKCILLIDEIPHNYRNDAFNIHINLPIKSFSNTKDKNRSGIRKNILAHCPQIFASNITDDRNVVNGRKIITGGFAPSIGVVQHLDNMGIITTNNFVIELRNMNDDTPANQLFKSIVNFSIFS